MNDEFHRNKLTACLFFIFPEKADVIVEFRDVFSKTFQLLLLLYLQDVVTKHPFLSAKKVYWFKATFICLIV